MDSQSNADRLPFPAGLLIDRRFRTGLVMGAGMALVAWTWLHFRHNAALEGSWVQVPVPSHIGSSVQAPPPPVEPSPRASADGATTQASWRTVTVQHGDTLSRIFSRVGLPAADWIALLKAPAARKVLHSLRPGKVLHYREMPRGRLETLRYPVDLTHRLVVSRSADGFRAQIRALPVEHRQARVTGTVRHSLFHSGREAGLSQRLVMQLTHIFKWEINFKEAVRAGDYFEVVYRQLWKNGRKVRNGSIVAAQYVNHGKRYRAYRFTLPDGKTGYYDADGKSISKGIERAPLHYKYISSGFSYHRFDPVVHVWRPHYGVDYAAPVGTPVHAAADGRVVWAARDGGYGNLVVIRSFGRYKTYYAHLHRFAHGLHKGEHVHQGQLIGYVGQTGEATGPHLHFGIMVNGRWRNPRTVPLPSDRPVPRRYLAEFKEHVGQLRQTLDTMEAERRLRGQPTRMASAAGLSKGH